MSGKNHLQDDSDINIGIIGPKELVDQTRETLKSFPNFKPVFQIIESSSLIPEITKELMNDVEVLMFTEYHSYNSVKQVLDFTIPVHHMPLMGTGLYRSLFVIKSRYSLKCLSIDTVEKSMLNKFYLNLKKIIMNSLSLKICHKIRSLKKSYNSMYIIINNITQLLSPEFRKLLPNYQLSISPMNGSLLHSKT